jgi:phosphoglycolate phosphatase
MSATPQRFRAVIFDLDGTLLDSLQDIADSMNAVLARLGHPAHPLEDYKRLTGDGVVALIENALPPGAARLERVEQAGRMLRQEYMNNWKRHTRPYPGIPELLDALEACRIRMNILSNKLDEFTRLASETFLRRWRFDQVIGIRPDLPRKPDPGGALFIARAAGIPASDFLYLGDTDTDMQTATAAGMFPLGALWGFRTEEELTAHGARSVVRRPEEVLRYFDECPASWAGGDSGPRSNKGRRRP